MKQSKHGEYNFRPPLSRSSLVNQNLSSLVDYARSSQKKGLRAKILSIACELDPEKSLEKKESNCQKLAAAIEDIHQGSLIVDDIQDSSRFRRGRPALHVEYGLPLALNAGNFLYFNALRAALTLDLSADRILKLQSLLVDAMAEAHEGQALDLGVKVHQLRQEDIAPISHTAAQSKTGALVKAAFAGGYLLNSSFSASRFHSFLAFGEKWGASLQKLDDIGHYLSSINGKLPAGKAFEDFKLGRPTWVWGTAALKLSGNDFSAFRLAAANNPGGSVVRSILLDSGLLRECVVEITADLWRMSQNLVLFLQVAPKTEEKISRQLQQLNRLLLEAYVPPESFSSIDLVPNVKGPEVTSPTFSREKLN